MSAFVEKSSQQEMKQPVTSTVKGREEKAVNTCTLIHAHLFFSDSIESKTPTQGTVALTPSSVFPYQLTSSHTHRPT